MKMNHTYPCGFLKYDTDLIRYKIWNTDRHKHTLVIIRHQDKEQ